MKDTLLLALTFSITMTVGLHLNAEDPPVLIKHKLYTCSSLSGVTKVIEGEHRRYIGECSLAGYFVHGPTAKM